MSGGAPAVWRAARPGRLALVVLVYALGVAVAAARGATPDSRALVGAAALVPAAASVSYAEAYADRWSGDRRPRPGSDGDDAPATESSRQFALRAAASTLLVAGAFTVGSVVGGALRPEAATLLAAIVALGWAHSLEPVALAGRGLGELDAAAVGGLVLPAYGAATVGGSPAATALAALPLALLLFANLLAVGRSAPDDAAGSRTLAGRLAADRLRALYVASAAGAFLALGGLWAVGLPVPVAAAGLPIAPLSAWAALRYVRRRDPRPSAAATVGFAVCQLLGWLLVAV